MICAFQRRKQAQGALSAAIQEKGNASRLWNVTFCSSHRNLEKEVGEINLDNILFNSL